MRDYIQILLHINPLFSILYTSPTVDRSATHHLIAREILKQILEPSTSNNDDNGWKQNLSRCAREFINFCHGGEYATSTQLLEIVKRVFIRRDNKDLLGTEGAIQKQYAQLIHDIPSYNGRIDVLRYLTDVFPDEPHFHAHLGRFLGLNNDFNEAIKSIDLALKIQDKDSVLHHVRGMIYVNLIKHSISENADIDKIISFAKEASISFNKCRRLKLDKEYGYISEIKMLIRILDYASKHYKIDVEKIIIDHKIDPYIRETLSHAEDLLDIVRNLYVGEKPSNYISDCNARLQVFYGNHQTALQAWDNLLSSSGVNRPPIRRQIIWTILRKYDNLWYKITPKEIKRMVDLLAENLDEEVNDSKSLRLWLRAIRYSQEAPSLDSIIEKVAYWKANTGSLDAAFYLYLLHAIRAFEGSGQALADSKLALDECKAIARFRRDRILSFEWIGTGNGIQRLVHQSSLGEKKDGFWTLTNKLERINGITTFIDWPQKGEIEISGGLRAFFIPRKYGFNSGVDTNIKVTCFIGFSYDGLQAWEVKRKDT
ncbi:MAG: hypothetical protein HQL03_12870 [Nitrospirae bacterium]|nr:hypothetical protein [Nitrospirota bacterium]